MVTDFDKKLKEVKDQTGRLEIAEDLDTEEKTRKVIQTLKFLIDDLTARVAKLEKTK